MNARMGRRALLFGLLAALAGGCAAPGDQSVPSTSSPSEAGAVASPSDTAAGFVLSAWIDGTWGCRVMETSSAQQLAEVHVTVSDGAYTILLVDIAEPEVDDPYGNQPEPGDSLTGDWRVDGGQLSLTVGADAQAAFLDLDALTSPQSSIEGARWQWGSLPGSLNDDAPLNVQLSFDTIWVQYDYDEYARYEYFCERA